jgi:HK97 gp10 family phage protein
MKRPAMRLTGSEELKRALAEFGIQANKELADIVRGTAQNVRSHAVKAIQRGTKSGTVYEKTNPKRSHTASAPGEAPATDTGRLVSSLAADINGLRAEVSANTEYAAPLEFGTRKMEPRPFLFPALEKERPAWNRRLDALVDKAARGIIK